jgi:signal transduction histidine kinase
VPANIPYLKNAIHEAGFRVPHLLVNSISERKQQILQATFQSVRKADLKEEYKILMADSEEGRRRTEMVLGLIQKALCGDMQPLIEDQIRTGYIRVVQKVPLHNTLKVHTIMEQAITREFINHYSDYSGTEMNLKDLHEEVIVLNFVYGKVKEVVSESFLKTRDEIIEKRGMQIEGLYKLGNTLDDHSKISNFSQIFINEVSNILGAAHVILTINNSSTANKRFVPTIQVGSSTVALALFDNEKMDEILRKMVQVRVPSLVDHDGRKQFPVNSESIETIPSGYWLVVPIFTASRFFGFLSINTGKLNGQLFGADSYVILSVVSKIAQAMERNQYLVKLRKSQKMLQRLASRIIYMQEEERKKISAEIHDTIIQRLTGIWFKLLYLEETMPIMKQTDLESFVSLKSYVNDSIMEGRRIVYGLRPLMLDELGAKKTIEEYVKNFRLENSMEVDLDFKGDFSKLSPEKQTSVFRILQEAMENIKKHSNSKRARIRLDCTDAELSFFVEDFGTGKPKRFLKKKEMGKSHFGLEIMDERAKAVGGKVKYGYKNRGGFVVKGLIPMDNSRRMS